ncbi:hypothetical protein N826_30820 [Skermanella aerolata KACC 11604]|nr:hypothetical protein N826_30820 [Skermanella aerolata KACC 11604]
MDQSYGKEDQPMLAILAKFETILKPLRIASIFITIGRTLWWIVELLTQSGDRFDPPTV